MNNGNDGDLAFQAATMNTSSAYVADDTQFMNEIPDVMRNSQFIQNFNTNITTRTTDLSKFFRLYSETTLVEQEEIYHIQTLEGMLNANKIMQRYIMASPLLKERWASGEDIYQDYKTDDSSIGIDNQDYRNVTNGIIRENEHWEHFGDEHLGEDKELSFSEQAIILDTWDIAETALEEDDECFDNYVYL